MATRELPWNRSPKSPSKPVVVEEAPYPIIDFADIQPDLSKKKRPKAYEWELTQWANRACLECSMPFWLSDHDRQRKRNYTFPYCPVCEPGDYPDRRVSR